MSPRRPHRGWRPGWLVRASQIWLSELWTVAAVSILLVSLLGLGGRILLNAHRVARNSHTIAALESDNLGMRYEAGHLRAQIRLLAALRSFIGDRIPDNQIYVLTRLVYRSSQTFGYDPLLVLAVIRVESRFRPSAHGAFRSGKSSGALGLMQIKYETAQRVAAELGLPLASPADLLKPEINIPIGIGYLTKQIGYFKSFKLGLLAYNQGPGTILQNLKQNQPLATSYYQSVLRAYYGFKEGAEAADRQEDGDGRG